MRGFVAMLTDGLSGVSPAEIARLPDDLLPKLGLEETLGMTRRRGFKGIVARVKREVAVRAAAQSAAAEAKRDFF